MNNKEKKFVETRSRQQIISDNIEIFIDSRNLKRTDFQEKMWLTKQDYYKKKELNGSSYSIDDIVTAAKILNVTTNDLIYNDEEKISLEVITSKKYDPIMAQQELTIQFLNSCFEKPSTIIYKIVFINLILSIAIYFIAKYSILFTLAFFPIIILIFFFIKHTIGYKQTFIINYLDDIYYKIKNVNNNKYFLLMILRFFSITLFLIPGMIVCLTEIYKLDNGIYIIYLISIFYTAVINFSSFFAYTPKKFKKEIYEHEIIGYYSTLFNLISTASINILTTAFISLNNNYWFILIFQLISLIISSLEFSIISKKYNEYKLFYNEYEKKERELFPNNY